MNKSEFVQALLKVSEKAGSGFESMIQNPPGRKPDARIVRLATVLKQVDSEQRDILLLGMRLAASHMLNNILSILDGSIAISDDERFRLKLSAIENGVEVLLNDQSESGLSDIFRTKEISYCPLLAMPPCSAVIG